MADTGTSQSQSGQGAALNPNSGAPSSSPKQPATVNLTPNCDGRIYTQACPPPSLVEKTANEIGEAISNPGDGIAGGIKEAVNIVPDTGSLLMSSFATYGLLEVEQTGAFQAAIGNAEIASEYVQGARDALAAGGGNIALPRLNMSNPAQEGGADIVIIGSVLTGFLNLGKLAAKKLIKGAKTTTPKGGVVILRKYRPKGRKLRDLTSAEANKGFEKPPYKEGTNVAEYELTENEKFVRLYDGENSAQTGRWMMPESEIKGLTPEQVRDKFALPEIPTQITDVNVPAGTVIRVGEAGPIPGWGNGGGTQVQLTGPRIPTGSYTNPRSFP